MTVLASPTTMTALTTATSGECLRVDGLHLALRASRGHAARLVLRGIDLSVAAGEVHALVGESGAGKSMVGRAVLGVVPPSMELVAGGAGSGDAHHEDAPRTAGPPRSSTRPSSPSGCPRPTAARMRPRFGSLAKNAVLTSGECAIA